MARTHINRQDQSQEEPEPVKNWLDFATKDLTSVAIPIGTPFQAQLPDYTDPSQVGNNPSTEKWLGEQTWAVKDEGKESSRSTRRSKRRRILIGKEGNIGRGRPEICSCSGPGSPKCVEQHVHEERVTLRNDLQNVYESWKLNEMGDAVSESWSEEDQQTLKHLIEENPISEGEGFMKPALKSLPSKNRASILSYYLNVYLPDRISKESRSGSTNIDTDESDSEMGSSRSSWKKKGRAKPRQVYMSGRR